MSASLTVFIHTNSFKDVDQYYGVGSHLFPSGTSDTVKIIKAAHRVLDHIFKLGFAYKKGGVILNHIVPRTEAQLDLFNPDPGDNANLGKVMDLINKKFGPLTVKSAACGLNQSWKLRSDYKSNRFTTNWNEILKIKG